MIPGDRKKILQPNKKNLFNGTSGNVRTDVRVEGTHPKVIAVDTM